MRSLLILFIILFGGILHKGLANSANPIFINKLSSLQRDTLKVISFNIRLASAQDGINNWSNRKQLLKNYVESAKPDIMGVQEAELVQMNYIDSIPGYEYVGVGRDNGMSQGEFSAIFYNSDKLEVKESGTFWLSQTPKTPSMGWDAVCFRICTWAKFSDKHNREFYVLNTHFDHMGKTARVESARLIMSKVNLLDPTLPLFLSGDFNTESGTLPIQIIEDFLSDSRSIAENPDITDGMTFNNFSETEPAKVKIDFIFVNKLVKVLSFTTNKSKPGGHFISDHYPIEGIFIY